MLIKKSIDLMSCILMLGYAVANLAYGLVKKFQIVWRF